jgi:hypothetical protein
MVSVVVKTILIFFQELKSTQNERLPVVAGEVFAEGQREWKKLNELVASLSINQTTHYRKIYNPSYLNDEQFFTKYIREQCYGDDREGFSIW